MRIERERLAEVERARELMERDLSQAAEIQRQILPGSAPSIEGLDLAGYNRPCHGVGGDYYDFIRLPDGGLLVALGDVAGKGMPASLLMVNLQARVQLMAERAEPPAAMVESLNRALNEICPDNRFVTFFLAQVDPRSGRVVFSNGGHNLPLLVRVNGDVEKLEEGGPVLGAFPELQFRQAETQMAPGDSLVIYSDGVTEATDMAGEEYGEERFEQLVVAARDRSAAELVRLACDDLKVFTGDAPPADDVTIVVVRRT
jgi:sigma-B regulation protein RsbU (phosphoserine phosphatase)